jgi:hypothetical protein
MNELELKLIGEKNELHEKIIKLKNFIDSSNMYDKLPYYKQQILIRQLDVMIEYNDILNERISMEDIHHPCEIAKTKSEIKRDPKTGQFVKSDEKCTCTAQKSKKEEECEEDEEVIKSILKLLDILAPYVGADNASDFSAKIVFKDK